MPRLAGLVIAGGRSSRMGRDKLALTHGHQQWWQWQERTLLASGASLVRLSRRPDQDAPAALPCIQDVYTDIGPLAGLHAALARPSAELLAVLAVDMPLVSPAWFTGLLPHCDTARGACYMHGDFLEPLAAIYPACALPVVLKQIQAGRFSLQDLGRRLAQQGLLSLLRLPESLQAQRTSFNTPESLSGRGLRQSQKK